MARRRANRPGVGLVAQYATTCARCDREIAMGERITRRGDRYIHPSCASGQDED